MTVPDGVARVIARGAVLDLAGGQITEDLAFAAAIGLQQVRFDVSWTAAQPRAGAVHGGALEEVHAAVVAAHELGLQPWLRLLQPDVPRWFDDEGGFTDERAARTWWPRWVEIVADRLGDTTAGWVPFEAPFAMARRLIPADPRRHGELMDHLVVAWRDAWRILRGGPPVATSIDVATERPADDSTSAGEEAHRLDQLRWGLWLGGLVDGVIRIPGRADRPLADLAGSCDVVGLALRADVETALYRAAEQGPNRPLAITFRPPGDTDADRSRAVSAMWRAVRRAGEELPVVTVTVASLLDSVAAPGIATADRQLKDSGEAFLSDD